MSQKFNYFDLWLWNLMTSLSLHVSSLWRCTATRLKMSESVTYIDILELTIWMGMFLCLSISLTDSVSTENPTVDIQPWRHELINTYKSPAKRICVFEHSVMTNFNCACPAIQRGQGSGFLSEGSSWLTACMSEQRRFWRDCADAQARLNLRCSHMR